MSRVLRLGLPALVVLVLSACGANEQEAKARPLPEEEKALQPGEYRSEEYQPSISFKIGEGWTNLPPEASDELQIRRTNDMGGLGFANIHEIYKPSATNSQDVVKAPKDLVGWFQHHPYLQTTKPVPITVGGVKGVQFDMVVANLPEDNPGLCGSDCVDIARLSSGSQVWLGEGYKLRLIVFEDMRGETVTIGFVSPASDFDEFVAKAQMVLDTVKWRGS